MKAVREISAEAVTAAVRDLCIEANCAVGKDIKSSLARACDAETEELPRSVLRDLCENARLAEANSEPICQDTGMTVVFVETGQDAHVTGSLQDAINEGVRRGYEDGYLRKSVVRDPIRRENTLDNTPAIIHCDIVPGGLLKITVVPKGFGSENMSRLAMLTPSRGLEGVKEFVVETVRVAGPNPCPPVVVGVGAGGTMEKACLMAKHALLRRVGTKNSDPFWNKIEEELLTEINELGIGPAGFGGVTTALAVFIETFATHIAGLPVAVNISCHATRHATVIL